MVTFAILKFTKLHMRALRSHRTAVAGHQTAYTRNFTVYQTAQARALQSPYCSSWSPNCIRKFVLSYGISH
jgi:hypothetical protein